jgi:hypothetical protein
MQDATHEALAILRHEEDQTEHSEYRHFPSHTGEGAEAVVLPADGCDHIGCFADQVKLTRALVQDLDEATKEVKLLGEHGEEGSQKIMELEALCKKLREDAQKLREEKTKLEGMVEAHDELIMEFTNKYGYNLSDEDAAPPVAGPPPIPATPAAAPEEIIMEKDPVEMVTEQESHDAHDVTLEDVNPKPPQPRLFNMIMRDYEVNPSRMMDDLHELDDLDDLIEAEYDVDEWFPVKGSNYRNFVIESSLKITIKNKSLGVIWLIEL